MTAKPEPVTAESITDGQVRALFADVAWRGVEFTEVVIACRIVLGLWKRGPEDTARAREKVVAAYNARLAGGGS